MMSGINGSDYAFGASLIANASGLKQQVDTLTQQSSTGYIAPDFAGLDTVGQRTGAATALRLAPQIAQLTATQNNITSATTRIQASQSVMTQLTNIADQFETSATQLATTGSSDITALAGQAQDALSEVAALLNTQSNGVYLFSGQDTGDPAVPDADSILSSSFFTSIQSAVAGLGTNGVAATESAVTAAATANTPFASTLGTAPPVVDTGTGQTIGIGIIAGQNAEAVSSGYTTGSYMLDLMRNLATLGSLSASQTSASGFSTLATDIATSMQNVVTGLSTDSAMLGSRQDILTASGTQLGSLSTALSTQLSAAQDVDMPTVATQLTQAQTQLQASYQLIADLKNLSLVNYL